MGKLTLLFSFQVLACVPFVPLSSGQSELAELSSGILNARTRGVRGEEAETLFKLRGWVTFVNPATGLGFLQDRTGGMAFMVPSDESLAPSLGSRISIQGYVVRHQNMLMLSGSLPQAGEPPTVPDFEKVSNSIVPDVLARQFELTQAAFMQVHAELVHFRAVVRRVLAPLEPGGYWRVEVSSRTAKGMALLPWAIARDAGGKWKDREVDVTGVVACSASSELMPVNMDAVVFVPDVGSWKVRPQAMDPVFAQPAQTADELRDSLPRAAGTGRVHVRGVVMGSIPYNTIFLRTESGCIEVGSAQKTLFEPGDDVSVACWPQLKNGELTLTDGVFLRRGEALEPEPVEIESLLEESEADSLVGELVSLEGVTRDFFVSERRYRILLGLDDGSTCSAYQSLRRGEIAPEVLPLGTRVRVTGIGHPRWEGAPVRDGASFGVMLRSEEDIEVTKAAPTVTRSELIGLSWGLAFVAALVAFGLWVMKRKVRRQEMLIESITRRTASTDERRRIASEFHDNLNQHLVSASLHLETIQDALEKKPKVVPELVEDAVKVLQQCREEARSVIWNLRLGDGQKDLVELLRLWVEIRKKSSLGVKIDFSVEGEPFPVSDRDSSNIVRIAQEAVNNALNHASAKQVEMTLKFGPDKALALTIQDDGCGFSAPTPSAGDTGHYGLVILRERAKQVHGRVDIRSEKKQGTRVRLVVPVIRDEGADDE